MSAVLRPMATVAALLLGLGTAVAQSPSSETEAGAGAQVSPFTERTPVTAPEAQVKTAPETKPEAKTEPSANSSDASQEKAAANQGSSGPSSDAANADAATAASSSSPPATTNAPSEGRPDTEKSAAPFAPVLVQPPVIAAPAIVAPMSPAATPQSPSEASSQPATTAAPAAPASPQAETVGAADSPKPAFTLEMGPAINRLTRAEARDRNALAAVYAERQGAPIWVTAAGRTPAADSMLAEIRRAGEWGLDPAEFDLPPTRSSGGSGITPEKLAQDEAEISAAVLKYARHARGGRVEPSALTKFIDRRAPLYDSRSILKQIATAADPAEYLRDLHPQHPQFKKLREKYLEARANGTIKTSPDAAAEEPVPAKGKAKTPPPARAPEGSVRRLLANMEQWRWMPNDLGAFYVWVNIPEYTVRVVANGKVVHSERVIVGKIDTQTPLFSDEMEQVIFHPFWGVPDSIKQNEILPSLQGNGSVLGKYNLRIQSGGRDIDPRSVNWQQTDIRKFHVYQPPGGDNVLGVVKFRFPNKHDVYMHDTPTKSLFNQTVRTYSHGCMRVRDPVKLAEVILAHDKNMSAGNVRSLTQKDAPENNQVNLTRKLPVHITYFTASVDDDGRLKTFNDIYGHEERISLGIEGKMHLIKPVPEPKGPERAEPVASLRESSSPSIFSGFPGFSGPYGGSSGKGSGSTSYRDREWTRRAFDQGN